MPFVIKDTKTNKYWSRNAEHDEKGDFFSTEMHNPEVWRLRATAASKLKKAVQYSERKLEDLRVIEIVMTEVPGQ